MVDEPSQRVVDQRRRNRIMEEMWSLARGDEAAREDHIEYVESFFDWFHSRSKGMYPRSAEDWEGIPTLTTAEDDAVRIVLGMMVTATENGGFNDPEDAVGSGWPRRIAPHAQHALDLMLARGRFDEENEEAEPSTPIPWPPL